MKLALISDLHFGTVPRGLADELSATLNALAPDLVVIAGDLTQRARPREFGELADWLSGLCLPTLVTPGNHDLPYWNLFRRFCDPFGGYLHAAGTRTLMPVFSGGDGAVIGFNTTRSWQPHFSWQEGVARRKDVERAGEILRALPDGAFRAVAAHHPFMKMGQISRARAARRADRALASLARDGAEALLSGHLHLSFAEEVDVGARKVILIGAPTALSWRRRGEANGFWIIASTTDAVTATLWLRGPAGFSPKVERVFARQSEAHTLELQARPC